MAPSDQQATVSGTFDIFGLPIELRNKIREELLLHEHVHDRGGRFENEQSDDDWHLHYFVARRKYVPGYFRPCVLVRRPSLDSLGSPLIARVHPLFPVCKAVSAEAREIARKYVFLELDPLSWDESRSMTRRIQQQIECFELPKLHSLRRLYMSSSARVGLDRNYWDARTKWYDTNGHWSGFQYPKLYFRQKQTPLFKAELGSDGTWLALRAQRLLEKEQTEPFIKAIEEKFIYLDYDYRFTSADLLKIATVIQQFQRKAHGGHRWYLVQDEKDELEREAKVPSPDWQGDVVEDRDSGDDARYVFLKPEFRATVIRLEIPCLSQSKGAKTVTQDQEQNQ